MKTFCYNNLKTEIFLMLKKSLVQNYKCLIKNMEEMF